MLEAWQRADDEAVFESGWTFDHFYPLFGDSTEDCMDGWVTLTALLQATTRLRGGVLVSGMVYRHPAVLANMAGSGGHGAAKAGRSLLVELLRCRRRIEQLPPVLRERFNPMLRCYAGRRNVGQNRGGHSAAVALRHRETRPMRKSAKGPTSRSGAERPNVCRVDQTLDRAAFRPAHFNQSRNADSYESHHQNRHR